MSDQPTTPIAPAAQPTAYEVAARIAQHMTEPARWSAKTRTLDNDGRRYAELTRLEDGAGLGVTVGGYRAEDRITFRAHWPTYQDGRSFSPRERLSITCSASRDPKAMARDIERRLLGDYLPAYRAALDEVHASDTAAGEARRAAERIASAIGAELPKTSSYSQPTNDAPIQLYGGPADVYRIKLHPAYGEHPIELSFEVHRLDEATALRVLTLLAQTKRSE